jgi:acetyl-CoA synthetase
MIANYAGMEIRPGSMGRPLPGIEAGIVRRIEGMIHGSRLLKRPMSKAN